jgi:hypothetical protein
MVENGSQDLYSDPVKGALDPVGKEDADIDNDGKNTDKIR